MATMDELTPSPRRGMNSPTKARVCIVGAGISGLSTALCAITDGVLSGDQITIMAEKVRVKDNNISWFNHWIVVVCDDMFWI